MAFFKPSLHTTHGVGLILDRLVFRVERKVRWDGFVAMSNLFLVSSG